MSQDKTLTDADIRAVFLANGFTVKEGQPDLKPYVFAAARALIAAHLERAGQSVTNDAENWRWLRDNGADSRGGTLIMMRCKDGKDGIEPVCEVSDYDAEMLAARGATSPEAVTAETAGEALASVPSDEMMLAFASAAAKAAGHDDDFDVDWAEMSDEEKQEARKHFATCWAAALAAQPRSTT